MPIVRVKTASNPYLPLAWKTSLAVLALEKLLKLKEICAEELEALGAVAKQLFLFHKASEIDVEGVSRQPRLRSSFFALRAIKGERVSLQSIHHDLRLRAKSSTPFIEHTKRHEKQIS